MARTLAALEELNVNRQRLPGSDGLTAFEVVWPAIQAQQDPEQREALLEGLFGPRGPSLYGKATEVPEGIDHSWVFKYEIDGE